MNKITVILAFFLAVTVVQAASINGTVTGQNSEPLNGATVILLIRSGGGAGGGTLDALDTAITPDDGGYSFTDLDPGRYTLIASLEGYITSRTNMNIQSVEEIIARDIQLVEAAALDSSAAITGTVSDASSVEPVANAQVILSQLPVDPGGVITVVDTIATDDSGSFLFTNLVNIYGYSISVTAQGYEQAVNDLIRVAQGDTLTVDFALVVYVEPSGAISGTVTNSSNDERLADATVILRVGTPQGGGQIAWENLAEMVTNAEGTFIFTSLEPSANQKRYSIVVEKEGFNTYTSQVIDVTADTVVADAALAPVTLGNLHVFVGNETDGTPIEGATVAAALEVLNGPIYSGTTDSEGWVSFQDALTGDYTITVSASGYIAETQGRELLEGENDSATVLLQSDTLLVSKMVSGTVTDAEGNPVSDAEVMLQAQNQNDILTLFAVTGNDGLYSIEGIPVQYIAVELTVTADGYSPSITQINLQNNSTAADITLELDPTTGTIYEVLPAEQIGFSFSGGGRLLQIEGIADNFRVVIYSITGKKIIETMITPQDRSVSLPESVSGNVVFITLRSGSIMLTRSVIIPQ
jgi:protocatechuate 3,4-dioxygenase beta subunit